MRTIICSLVARKVILSKKPYQKAVQKISANLCLLCFFFTFSTIINPAQSPRKRSLEQYSLQIVLANAVNGKLGRYIKIQNEVFVSIENGHAWFYLDTVKCVKF